MSDEYPREDELKTISEWNTLERPVEELLDYIKHLWWMPDWGFKLSGKRILRLELHTGGWSGNEDIIVALQENFLFWALFWHKSIAGGHYWFTIKRWPKGESPHAACGKE